MSSEKTRVDDDDGKIDFVALAQVLRANKYLLILTTLTASVLAAVFAFTAAPTYRAEVVVTPADDSGMGGASSLASQLGGIASLAGVNLDSSAGNQEAQLLLQSRYLVAQFIERYNLLPLFSRDSGKTPTPWFVVRDFQKKVLSVKEEPRKGMTAVAIRWRDPVAAARWANDFVALANEVLRNRALNESKRNIEYLNEQIARTDVVELRRVMYGLIENETKKLMVANGKVEYAFVVIDPAVAPELRVSPQRTFIILAWTVVGFAVGCFFLLVRNLLGRSSVAQ